VVVRASGAVARKRVLAPLLHALRSAAELPRAAAAAAAVVAAVVTAVVAAVVAAVAAEGRDRPTVWPRPSCAEKVPVDRVVARARDGCDGGTARAERALHLGQPRVPSKAVLPGQQPQPLLLPLTKRIEQGVARDGDADVDKEGGRHQVDARLARVR